jgi:hypothetical protein
MLSTDRKRMHNPVLVCSFGLLLSALGPHALAGDDTTTHTPVAEGSSLTHRSQTDGYIMGNNIVDKMALR